MMGSIRRSVFLIWLIALMAMAVESDSITALAQDSSNSAALLEMPTTGAARRGPMAPTASIVVRSRAVPPVQIRIDKAGIDAPIEAGRIVDGVMQDPSGPWVVAWYEDLAALDEGGNAVLAGHVDYWDTGPAVFWNVKDLTPGDTIQLIAEDGRLFEYAVEWSKLYDVATELTPEVIQSEVVGPTGQEALTLITCGGPFDNATGEYLQRMVVRAIRTS